MSKHTISYTTKLFYSYCHADEEYREEMEKSLRLLKRNNLLEEWSDQKILPGRRIAPAIREKMEEAEIFVFLLSRNFIASDECMKEWEWAKAAYASDRFIFRIPIILEDCAWLDLLDSDDDVKALPKDGASISSFDSAATAWQQIYDGIKSVIEELRRNFTPKSTFLNEMEQTEFLSQENISLQDIYIFPRLTTYAPQSGKVQISDEIITDQDHLLAKMHALVHGPEMSGKTALSRSLFLYLVKKTLPVLYVDTGQCNSKNVERNFKDAYSNQFNGDYSLWISNSDKTILLDNLTGTARDIEMVNFAKSNFERVIITLSSDVFTSFFRDDSRLADFYEMKIEPLSHNQQEKLIRCRLALTQNGEPVTDGLVDKVEDRVNSIIISNKIVPRYPFYVLSILQTYEGFMPDNLSISSFGHCYHALIVAKLIKSGISQSDSDINSCFNFAEKLAYRIYKQEIAGRWEGVTDFRKFIEDYNASYIMATSTLNRLRSEQYGIVNAEGQFRAKYMYYFFLGRYFARSHGEHQKEVEQLCEEMHINTNRLILLFIIHHTNDHKIIDDIMLRVMCAIEGVEPAVLDMEESHRFFDIFASVPKNILTSNNVEAQRIKEREIRDSSPDDVDEDEEEKPDVKEHPINDIFKVLKCNQILGQILRNKYGSLERSKIEEIVETIADGGLRLVNCILRNEEEIENVAEYIRQKYPKYQPQKIEQMIRFFSFIWTMTNVENVVHAINVPEIRGSIGDVVRRKNTAAYDLLGYFSYLDSSEQLTGGSKDELDKLLKKYRYPFMRNVLSIRTQRYMNTHTSRATVEQSICSSLRIKYVPKFRPK